MPGLRTPPLPFHHPVVWLSTWFGSGLIRPASGTWGSLAALPFAWIIQTWYGPFGLLIASFAIYALGCWVAGLYERADKEHDPSAVVIDEVAGQWLCLMLAPPALLPYLICFLLFRFFDIVKPWPISLADQKLKGGLGIMTDDLLAGFFGLTAYSLLTRLDLFGVIDAG